MQELLYTSAPRGLKPGSRGFCTVLSTQGMVAPLAAALEALSGYRPVFPIGHARVAENPVVYSHLKLQVAGKSWYVLSRIADYGLDYSQRTNKLAHHLVLDKSELPAAGPASLLRASGIMRESWEGDPKIVPPKPISKQPSAPSGVCQAWKEMTGDAGWAGVLAESFLKDPNRPAILLFEPGQDLRPLIDESLSLLPAERRWDVTFSTYFTGSSQGNTCLWRGIVLGSKEATESLRFVNALRIDLTSTDIGRAEGGELVEAARKGIRPAVHPTLSRKQTASREQQEPRVMLRGDPDEPTVSQTACEAEDIERSDAPVVNHDHLQAPPRLTRSAFKFANVRSQTDDDDQVGRTSRVRKRRMVKIAIAAVVLLIVSGIGFSVYLAIQARVSTQTLAAIDGFIAGGKLEEAREHLDQHSSRLTSVDWLAVKKKLATADQQEHDRKEELKSVLEKVADAKDADSALKHLERGHELARTSEEKAEVDKMQEPWREEKKERDRKAELESVLNAVAAETDSDSALKQLVHGRELASTQEEKREVSKQEDQWREKKEERDRKAELESVLNAVAAETDADSALKQLERGRELARTEGEKEEVGKLEKQWQEKRNAATSAQTPKPRVPELSQQRASLPEVNYVTEATLYDFKSPQWSGQPKMIWFMPKNQEFKSLEVINREDGSLALLHAQGSEKSRAGLLSIHSSKLLFKWDENASLPLRTHVFDKLRFCFLELRVGAKPVYRFFFFPNTRHQAPRPFKSSSLKLVEDSKSDAARLLGRATKLGIHLQATDVSIEFDGKARRFEPTTTDAKNLELRSQTFAKEYCQNFVKLTMNVDPKDGGKDLEGNAIGPTARLSLQIAAERSEEKDSHEDEDAADEFRKALDGKCKEYNVESPPFFIFRDLKKPDDVRKKINEKFQLAWQKRSGGGKSWKDAYDDTNTALKPYFDKVDAVAKRFDDSQQWQNDIKTKSQFGSADIVYQVSSRDGQREQITLVRFEAMPSSSNHDAK